MSWLTIRIDDSLFSPADQMSITSARRLSAVRASTWLNGSSKNSISGSTVSARAMPTRCFMPPEQLARIPVLEAGEADHADSSPRRAFVDLGRGRGRPPGARPTMFSVIVIQGRRRSSGTRWRRPGSARQRLGVIEDLALRRPEKPGEDAQDRRLAAAGRAEQGDDFLGTDDQVDVLEHAQRLAVGWA